MKIVHGNIWDTDADAIVIPVNCTGVMGAGLAKQAADRFPLTRAVYGAVCDKHLLRPGRIFIDTSTYDGKRLLLAATKDHWRDPSRIEWIEDICATLKEWYTVQNIGMVGHSVAVPLLGCGLGGLSIEEVLPIMEQHFADIDAIVYAPGGES